MSNGPSLSWEISVLWILACLCFKTIKTVCYPITHIISLHHHDVLFGKIFSVVHHSYNYEWLNIFIIKNLLVDWLVVFFNVSNCNIVISTFFYCLLVNAKHCSEVKKISDCLVVFAWCFKSKLCYIHFQYSIGQWKIIF